VEWSRTLRIDAPATDALREHIAKELVRDGMRVEFSDPNDLARTYVLVEGPQSVDPAELESPAIEGRWYSEAIIALAIEPEPSDALPPLAKALGGAGAPAGVIGCETSGASLIVEVLPSVTQPRLVLDIADVELRRFSGRRRVRLLGPVPRATLASIAAAGLQAPEIGEDRILESLLERAHVE
jgi:hypothetical protein